MCVSRCLLHFPTYLRIVGAGLYNLKVWAEIEEKSTHLKILCQIKKNTKVQGSKLQKRNLDRTPRLQRCGWDGTTAEAKMKRRTTPSRALRRGLAAEMCWSVEVLVGLQRCAVPLEISSDLFWASSYCRSTTEMNCRERRRGGRCSDDFAATKEKTNRYGFCSSLAEVHRWWRRRAKKYGEEELQHRWYDASTMDWDTEKMKCEEEVFNFNFLFVRFK